MLWTLDGVFITPHNAGDTPGGRGGRAGAGARADAAPPRGPAAAARGQRARTPFAMNVDERVELRLRHPLREVLGHDARPAAADVRVGRDDRLADVVAAAAAERVAEVGADRRRRAGGGEAVARAAALGGPHLQARVALRGGLGPALGVVAAAGRQRDDRQECGDGPQARRAGGCRRRWTSQSASGAEQRAPPPMAIGIPGGPTGSGRRTVRGRARGPDEHRRVGRRHPVVEAVVDDVAPLAGLREAHGGGVAPGRARSACARNVVRLPSALMVTISGLSSDSGVWPCWRIVSSTFHGSPARRPSGVDESPVVAKPPAWATAGAVRRRSGRISRQRRIERLLVSTCTSYHRTSWRSNTPQPSRRFPACGSEPVKRANGCS